jgi:hypothetical protein
MKGSQIQKTTAECSQCYGYFDSRDHLQQVAHCQPFEAKQQPRSLHGCALWHVAVGVVLRESQVRRLAQPQLGRQRSSDYVVAVLSQQLQLQAGLLGLLQLPEGDLASGS